jgi:hypothetical protein
MEAASNSLNEELQAMAAIGQALDNLADPAVRQRVLRWAAERFALETAFAPGGPSAESVTALGPVNDPDLAVDSLHDMFVSEPHDLDDDLGEFGGPVLVEARLEPQISTLPIETVIRSFAADFRAFADEWNGAAAEQL